jgi:hypothetical protein
MSVSGIGSASSAMVMDRTQAGAGGDKPRSITKTDLVAMRDRAAQSGEQAPPGIDKLVDNFDKAAGEGGKMTADQFRSYASDNGVTLPSPPKGGDKAGGAGGKPPAGGPPPGGGGGAVGAHAGASGAATSSSSTKDVSTESDADLAAEAAKGDLAAIREIARRAAAKAREAAPAADEVTSVVDALDAARFAPSST